MDGELDLKDPTLHSDEIGEDGKPKFSLERYRGPLFELGAQHTDAVQGQIGDCYFPAAVAAIAFHVPGHFEKMMQMKSEIDEITGQQKVWYEVTFKARDYEKGGFKDEVVKVDGDLYIRSWGGPLYGSDDGARTPEDMELWFAILEKAYAQWKGDSYEAVGNGGFVSQVFEDMLGVEAGSMGTYDADSVWKTITSAVDDKRAIGAGTRGESDEALYANTGVYANHAYSILSYEEKDGVKYVTLRNPWGESEPSPGDGNNDGIFKLTLDQFQKLYAQVYFVEKP
jgi:Calpain family cysteine protease